MESGLLILRAWVYQGLTPGPRACSASTLALSPTPLTKRGERGLFDLHFPIIVHHWRKSEQEVEQDWNLEQELMQVL